MLNKVCFDWFSFTIKNKSLDVVMADLGLRGTEFHVEKFSRFGYGSMITHDVYNLSVLFDGTDDMGIHVIVSGGAIKFFMECYTECHGIYTPFGPGFWDTEGVFGHFAKYVLNHGHFSRVDVNIDTNMPFMSPYNLRTLAQKNEMISLYRSWDFYENSDGSGTLYIGKRASAGSFIRIYDKAKEQGDFESALYRFEVEFKKTADDFMNNLLENGLNVAFHSFITRQLRFVPAGDYFDTPYVEWTDFLELIVKGEKCSFRKYDSKQNKTSVDTLLHMFNQYHNVISDFLTEIADVDDFIEFMFVSFDSFQGDRVDIVNFLYEKGWKKE